MKQKVYLGDSVYAEWTGTMVKLTTENGYGPSNEIFLEDEVLESLIEFRKIMNEHTEHFVSEILRGVP